MAKELSIREAEWVYVQQAEANFANKYHFYTCSNNTGFLAAYPAEYRYVMEHIKERLTNV